jgi:thiol peroxidase
MKLAGKFPNIGDTIGSFTLTNTDLRDTSIDEFLGESLILNIFPSVDTPVCSSSVIKFNSEAGNLNNYKVLCISKDLPFAQARFCGVENIENVTILSAFRFPDFAQILGVDIVEGFLKGLLARSIVVLNPQRKVIYTELVTEITNKPNYDKCLEAIA